MTDTLKKERKVSDWFSTELSWLGITRSALLLAALWLGWQSPQLSSQTLIYANAGLFLILVILESTVARCHKVK